MKCLVLFALICFGLAAAIETYDGYKVYTVTPKTKSHADILLKLERPLHLDFWQFPRALNRNATVMVRPNIQHIFERKLSFHGIPHDVLIPDVKKTIILEQIRQNLSPPTARGDVSFTKYMRHDEINSYLETLADEYPDIVTLEEIGQSYENRAMKLVRINNGDTSGKPTIFVDAGIHAREWIAPPVALYIIYQLVENASNSDLYQNVNWIVLPSVNPDGYEYTQTNQRLWRKTRSQGRLCDGADANRNFGFHWMEEGADDYECSEIYAGSEAFSEVEARNLRDFLLENNADGNIKLYLTLHSYGPYILYPWGYNDNIPDPDNIDELVSVGNDARSAILAVRGTDYFVGNSGKDLYPAAGASDDWSKGVAGIPLSYTIELPGGGSAGFNPPASAILPVVQETWEGIKVFQNHIEKNYGRSKKCERKH